jgi:hypothetical protein
MQADNSDHLAEAARRRREQTLSRAHRALRELEDSDQPVTIATVAARAWQRSLRRRSPGRLAITRSRIRAQDLVAEVHLLGVLAVPPLWQGKRHAGRVQDAGQCLGDGEPSAWDLGSAKPCRR